MTQILINLDSTMTSPFKKQEVITSPVRSLALPTNLIAPDQYTSALSQIASQLDLITSTLGMLQDRMIIQEEKINRIEKK